MTRQFAVLGLAVAIVFQADAQDGNLFGTQNSKVRCEYPVVAANHVDKNLLVITQPSAASPAVYFGTVHVQPGKQYTYVAHATLHSTSRVLLYVASDSINVVWPGSEIINESAAQTFTVPNGVVEIRLAIAFLNPIKQDSALVHGIGLFEATGEHERNKLYRPIYTSPSNIITEKDLQARCEDGVTAGIEVQDDNSLLKITASPTHRDPSIYLASVKVKPGADYTYRIVGDNKGAGRALLYVTSPKGNLVWPGDELQEGSAQSFFRIPKGTDSVTLALAFLKPEKKQVVFLKEIALYEGYVNDPDAASKQLDFAHLFINQSAKLYIALFLATCVCLVIIFILDSKLRKSKRMMRP
jgi:hypothetical protein